ncbi:MAG: D-sedoheptulose 7-phosphate isomerase [Chloroflexi bacterium]|nr:D-sedoheptulose 7-phosphate isomerase [Chloroflexota bacterium]
MKDKIISRAIEESMEVQRQVLEQCMAMIVEIAAVLIRALREGHKVVLFGNGGSAADAQHVAAELVNRFLMERAALPAIALTTDTSILTSVSNDASFAEVFARQVEALVQEGDVAVGISTSGNSPSVLNGILAAGGKGAITVGFTGRSGGKLKELVDLCLCVPSDHTPRIQEAHITVWHAICEVVEQELFGA